MGAVEINKRVFEHDAQQTGFDPNTHVDLGINYLRLISQRGENRILEGIRGTGKTHLMRMVSHKCVEDFDDKKVLPIYISLAGLPEVAQDNKNLFMLYFSQKVINEITNFMEKNQDKIVKSELDKKNIFQIIKTLFGFDPLDDMEENFKLLQTIAKRNIDLFTLYPEKLVKRLKEKSSTDEGISVSTDILSINSGNRTEEEIEQISEYALTKFLDIYAIDLLLKFLLQVRKMLNLSYIYLLIDECSETKLSIQKETLRICKRIRGLYSTSSELDPEIAFMISVYPTQYYPSMSRGDDFNFEPGNDCTIEYLELDELSDEYEEFFNTLISYRLKTYNVEGSKEVSEVFENGEGKCLAAYAAGGIPRRYLEIIKQSYDLLLKDYQNATTDTPKKISKKYVQEAIQKVVDGQLILKNNKLIEEDHKYLSYLISRFSKRNKMIETKKEKGSEGSNTLYFVTASENEKKLSNLINVGIIHDKKRSRSRKSGLPYQQGTGTMYLLDFGVAFHRGAIYKQKALDIARSELKESANRGYQYALDIKFEDESLDEKIRAIEEYISEVEEMQMKIDRGFLEGKLDEQRYEFLFRRYDEQKKRLKIEMQRLEQKRNS